MTESAAVSSPPLLTIVTVTCDDPDGLTQTLDSVVEQDHFDAAQIEWLIVDSSSDRDFAAAISERGNSALPTRLIWVERDGVYPAMNSALDHIRGTFVLFLNGGDRLASPTVLNLLLRELGTLRSSSLTWWIGRVRIVDRAGRAVTSAAWDFRSEKRYLFARGVFPPHQATVVRTQTLRDLSGFDTSYRVAADYHAALRLSLLAEPVVSETIVAEFHEGGISTTEWKRAASEFHRARIDAFDPSFTSRIVEGWHTIMNGAAMLVYRDILRRDR